MSRIKSLVEKYLSEGFGNGRMTPKSTLVGGGSTDDEHSHVDVYQHKDYPYYVGRRRITEPGNFPGHYDPEFKNLSGETEEEVMAKAWADYKPGTIGSKT